MTEIPSLLDEYAAGRYLGGDEKPIAARTLQRWRFQGDGPAYVKIGRLVRYRIADLDEFIKRGARQATSVDAGL